MNSIPPTVFHITHWKAGSQWVAEVLRQSAPDRFVASKVRSSTVPPPYKLKDPPPKWQDTRMTPNQLFTDPNNDQLRVEPLVPGAVYGTVYSYREYFEHLVTDEIIPKIYWVELTHFPRRVFLNWWNFGIKKMPYKCFFFIRDLRDTFVSLYFSEKTSHAIMHEKMKEYRHNLAFNSKESGLMHLIQNRPAVALIQTSWYGVPGVPVFRYENLVREPFAEFKRMVDFCGIDISNEKLKDIVLGNQFDAVSGRQPGQEDVSSHYRKGIIGDWKNHFTDKVKSEFKLRYGQVLIDTGYEKDLDW